MKPMVAIVGRPNVGKSTLFNRIIRRRAAIVDDAPGVTRDRKTAETEWDGIPFALVDTGGYIPQTRDTIAAGVTEQVRFAINEADLIILLVDVTTGITDIDGDVAVLLRKSAKPVVVAVNKVDSEKREADSAEFVRLGLGEPVPVSALISRGVGDLLSRITDALGQYEVAQSPSTTEKVNLAVIGRPNVGKSTFVNTILGQKRLLVTEIPGTTRDSVDVAVQYKDREMTLVDTAGMRRRSKVHESIEYYSALRTHQTVERCDVACVFTDADLTLAQQDLRIVREVMDARKGVLLVVNKWDLVRGDPDRVCRWKEDLIRRLHGFDYVPFLFVSCKTGYRVKSILEKVCQIADERTKRIPSAALNKMLEEINQRYQPPAVGGKRVRILYATQVDIRPPRFVFFANHPHLIQAASRNFLENQIREQFGFEGVPISMSMKKK